MVHFDKNFGLFVGKLTSNDFHKHYAVQISVTVNLAMCLNIQGEREYIGNSFYSPSKIEHQLFSAENQLTILINPLSPLGHQLYLNFGNLKTIALPNEFTEKLMVSLLKLEKNKIDFNQFCSMVKKVLNEYQCSCRNENHSNDNRIIKALEFIDVNFDKVYNLEEIAERCFLSPSRFLHLFKEKTGLNFRRYQLWNRLIDLPPLYGTV